MTVSESVSHRCSVCGSSDLTPIAHVSNAPVFCNVLLPTRQEALDSPAGDIDLAVCRECTHVSNTSFNDELLGYSVEYENSLHFSPTFQEFATSLAERLVSTYGVRDSQVVELGCGKGDFLAMLAAAGNNEAVGFDPSYDGGVDHHEGPGSIRVVADTYEVAGRELEPALVASRHVLEHLTDPGRLIRGLSQWRSSDPLVYLEVPDADYMISQAAVWDVIYEHPSYFTAESLARLCSDNGLTPVVIESVFGGQYLSIHARLGGPTAAGHRAAADPQSFGDGFTDILERWATRLSDLHASGRSAAVWGAGSKGVSFAAVVGGASEAIELAIDLNPRKKGRFMPGSGVEVSTPDDARLAETSLVLVMNPLYEDEIRHDLQSRGLDPDVEVVT